MPGLLIALLIMGLVSLIVAGMGKLPWYVPVGFLYVILMIQVWPK